MISGKDANGIASSPSIPSRRSSISGGAGVKGQNRLSDVRTRKLRRSVARRHLTKSQQAIAVAMIFPEGGKGGRGIKADTRNLALNAKFSQRLLDEARLLKWAPGWRRRS
jgi:hypothetical protein